MSWWRDPASLVVGSPVVFCAIVLLQDAAAGLRLQVLPGAALSAILLAVGGATMMRHKHGIGGLSTVLGLILAAAVCAPALVDRPALALLLLLASATVVFGTWDFPSQARLQGEIAESVNRSRAATASAAVMACWLALETAPEPRQRWMLAALAIGLLLFFRRTRVWLAIDDEGRRIGRIVAGITAVALLAAVALVVSGRLDDALRLTLVPTGFILMAIAIPASGRLVDVWGIVTHHPARLLVVTFLLLIAVGTIGLALPWSAAPGTQIALIDASFTSVSAVCVTGLIVLDTPTAFSPFGQLVLLLLIQFGGLGIMSLSTAAVALLGRRLSLKHEGAVAELLGGADRDQLFRALRFLLLVTAAFELAGASLLYPVFRVMGDGAWEALWRAIFTAVSAFCNAGFALQTESLVPYQSRPLVLHVVALLIVAGGLSPAVLASLAAIVRHRRVALGAKMSLAATAALLIVGFVSIAALEWGASLSELSFGDRLHNAWFQSVTLRTAGFNSVSVHELQPATLTLMMAMMFIGGSPGGTAGGIKTTTFVVLVLAVVGAVRGRWQASAFGRSLPHSTIYRAAAIATLGMLSVLFVLLLIQLTQTLSGQAAVFEVVSALGTVGLSLGGTGLVDDVGKLVLMVAMFLGRVGPLTAFLFLYERRAQSGWTRPEEDVQVG